MWLIVRQLPMKAGWRDTPLALSVLAVNNLPQFPSFCKSQLTPHCDRPPPSFLHANFVAIRENIFSSPGESNQGFCSESSTSQPPTHILILCCTFYRFFHATTTVQDWHWTYSPFQSLRKTFLSAPPRPNI